MDFELESLSTINPAQMNRFLCFILAFELKKLNLSFYSQGLHELAYSGKIQPQIFYCQYKTILKFVNCCKSNSFRTFRPGMILVGS